MYIDPDNPSYDPFSKEIALTITYGPKRDFLPTVPPPFKWRYHMGIHTYSLWYNADIVCQLYAKNVFQSNKEDIYWHVNHRINYYLRGKNGLL